LLSAEGSQINYDMTPDATGLWVVQVPDVVAGQRYGYRVHGQWRPDQGLRANPAKLLLDPYARAVSAGVDYSGPIFDHTAASDFEPDSRDSAHYVPLSVVVEPSAPPEPINVRRSLAQTVIYEAHVKGLTRNHPGVPEHLRGSYLGLGYPAVIDHLLRLGITAVELLPIHHFVSEPFLIRKGLDNYWGYNTLAFLAPHSQYGATGTTGEQVSEFKQLVSALHRAGIEVILDVVYNHTCEGNHEGPTLAYRGFDHRGYYRLTPDLLSDYDVTGTGNSLDTSQDDVLALVLDSMRYWVSEMGVDGFRFDLATTLIRNSRHCVDQAHEFKQAVAADPIFADIKMIAEPWDIGPDGYQVGAWGPRWSEWNDHFRDTVRDFWRGALPGVQELATRLAGSADLFQSSGREPSASVNFITAHDGFTMRDLVSYNDKHNEANGENNRDGSDNNRSWNCGIEGETTDENVVLLRHRQVRNLLFTLLTADGVPMLAAGDELGRTQQGNNNAYCQDCAISWVDWEQALAWSDVADLIATLTTLRSANPVLTPESYAARTEAWFAEDGTELTDATWSDPNRRFLARYIQENQRAFLACYYAGDAALTFTLPTLAGIFQMVATSALPGELPDSALQPGDIITLPARTTVLFRLVIT
jgi:glycogen operon protein